MAGNPGSEAAAAYHMRSIDARIALEHGVAAAFVYHQIGRWCVYNKAEGIAAVKIGGKYYMFMSHVRIQAVLPWMDISTIRRAIKTLIQAGLLESRLRKGTKAERLSSPAALMYRAKNYVDAGVFKMNNRGRQNEQVRGVQNEQVDLVKVEPEKKKQKRRVYASASKGENRTKTTTTTREHTPRSTRSTDGFETFAQAIEEAPKKKPQPQPLRPKPLSDAQIRINEAAQAAQAAEDEERLIPELRNLVAILLESRDVPQSMRETIEAAIQREIKNPEVLGAWVKDLEAMPQSIAEAIDQAIGKPRYDMTDEEREKAEMLEWIEEENREITKQHNHIAILLESRDVPQPIREIMETALRNEQDPEVLRRWVNQLQAMPKLKPETFTAAEAAG